MEFRAGQVQIIPMDNGYVVHMEEDEKVYHTRVSEAVDGKEKSMAVVAPQANHKHLVFNTLEQVFSAIRNGSGWVMNEASEESN